MPGVLTLLSLPSELIAAILSFTDFPTLSRSVQTCSTINHIWKGHQNHICRLMCIITGLADAQTTGAGASLHKDARWAEKGLAEELDPEELRNVIEAQGWMDQHAEITSWKNYARFRYTIHRNWLIGRAHTRLLKPEMPQGARFWRFKLDSKPGFIVVSGLMGGTFAFKGDGTLAWSIGFPRTPYPHVELSNGFLPVNWFHDNYVILRRDDITPVNPVPTSLTVPPQDLASMMTRVPNEHGYQLDGFGSFEGCRATKLRYPTFLAADRYANVVFYYDIPNRMPSILHLPSFISDEHVVRYVEIDDGLIFIAGLHSITIWRLPEVVPPKEVVTLPRSARIVWPPNPPQDQLALASVLPESHYRGEQINWSAVHHDGCGRHLVATSEDSGASGLGRVLWTTDYRHVLFSGDEDLVEQKTAVLVTDDASVIQLAVENDRAVFLTAVHGMGTALWLLNLRDFDDLADFSRDPPRPICLAWPLPTTFEPSRVEMTSNEIYVPVLAHFLTPDGSAHHRQIYDAYERCRNALPPGKMPIAWRWQKLDGQTLVDYEADVADQSELQEAWDKVQRPVMEPGDQPGGADAFLVFSFDGETA
ncbi:proteophosphoglycan ppg4 [Rhodotorula toruloides]|uniref:Proteophosphoglycan ppg4 n=1 Tax=Rhodotorula toruloides TaxID=5286 RepID=A0A511KI16_RHOTO|nr:proteophosphoglycan ppg4 [Rhodotorula toruloides]